MKMIGTTCASCCLFFSLMVSPVWSVAADAQQETLKGQFVMSEELVGIGQGIAGALYKSTDGSTWAIRVYKASELSVVFADKTLRSGNCTASESSAQWVTRYSGMNTGNLGIAMIPKPGYSPNLEGTLTITCVVNRAQ